MWLAQLLAALLATFHSGVDAVETAVMEAIDAAVAERQAVRDVPHDPDAVCDLDTVTALAARHPGVRQFVVMATDDFAATRGTVELAVRDRDGRWLCQRSAQPAMFGRNGTRPLADRRSGDGTTPAGVFPLGEVTAWDGQTFSFFGNSPDPGVLAPYRDVRPQDCWGATPNTARYQQLIDRPGCSAPDEWLTGFGDAYTHAAVIGANLDPVSGDAPGEAPFAAAIFLHRNSDDADGRPKPTSGCVALDLEELVASLRLLDPALRPHFAIGPTAWLRSSG